MNKKDLSERDICSKFVGPAVKRAGWDGMMQIREEVAFTKGRIIVRGKLVSRGKAKRADYIPYHKPNIPIAIIEVEERGVKEYRGFAHSGHDSPPRVRGSQHVAEALSQTSTFQADVEEFRDHVFLR